MTIGFELFHERALLPKRAHESDACFDVYACEPQTLKAGAVGVVKLGWGLQLPEGWEAQLRGRSGLASQGIWCHFGTIDHLYRLEVGTILANLTDRPFLIRPGDRVAQLAFAPIVPVRLKRAVLEPTERGGFGSTGLGEERVEQ